MTTTKSPQRRPIQPSEPAALTAIRAEAARLGWPLQFATDLDHDANAIAAMLPREPFTWCLRSDGTHIGRVVDANRSAQSQLTMCMVADSFTAEACRFYLWDGATLQPVYTATAADGRLGELAAKRFEVRPRRVCSLLPHRVATRREADALAVRWEERYGEGRYGEGFVTVDTWERV